MVCVRFTIIAPSIIGEIAAERGEYAGGDVGGYSDALAKIAAIAWSVLPACLR